MAGEILWINDIDSRELGIYPKPGSRGMLGTPARTLDIQQVLDQPGGIIGAIPSIGVRNVSIPAVFVASSIETVGEEWRAVQQILRADEVRLCHAFDPDLEYLAKWTGEDPTEDGQALEPILALSLTFVCENPYGRVVTGRPFSVEFDDTPQVIPCGLGPCRGKIILREGNDPVITLHDSDGNAVATMGFDLLHASGQQTEIESHLHKVMLNDNDVLSDARASLVSGHFFEVDPLLYGDYVNEAWPMLSVQNALGEFIYDKQS